MAKKTASKQATSLEISRSVDPQTGIELLKRQIQKAEELLTRRPLQSADHTAWNNTTRDYLIKTFGSASPNVNAVLHASSDHGLYRGMGDAEFERYETSELTNQIKMLTSCIEQLETEIELSDISATAPQVSTAVAPGSNRVFVVHGHNHGVKESVARFLEKLELEPVILHEKPNAGRTIIEKFSDYSDVRFAVVLATADDEGRLRGTDEPLRARARQNVVLELGYFLGKLSRARVCVLYEDGVDIPSDYRGVLFVPFDNQDNLLLDLTAKANLLIKFIESHDPLSQKRNFFNDVILSREASVYKDTQVIAIAAFHHGFDGLVYKSVRKPAVNIPDSNLVMFTESKMIDVSFASTI